MTRVFLLLAIVTCLCGNENRAQLSRQPFEKTGVFQPHSQPVINDQKVQGEHTLNGSTLVDILRYDIDLRLAMVSEELRGTVTITLVMKTAADSVTLNSAQLQFDSVFVDGFPRTFTLSPASESFSVYLGAVRAAGDTVGIVIWYQRPPGLQRPSSRRGYYFFLDTIGIPANLGYTMSEPSEARFWFPCLDQPWEKATATMELTVPSGYVAASNGRLISTRDNGDGTATWRWKEGHQIAPYLMCATVSRFGVSALPYVRSPGDTIPIQYFTWAPDSQQAADYLPVVRQMLSTLSRLYGPYPFEKYGMSGVVPFAFGGMEHQTMTTLNRFYLTDERVVVHELAHQWWGDLVTCGTWADVWLNESFATYSEALWEEYLNGKTGLTAYMKGLLHFFFGSWQGSVYDPASQGFNLFDDVVYSKGAWVLHTLRGVVGDSTFFKILQAYRQRFAEGNAVTGDLAAVVDDVTGTDMSWFFRQWVLGKGWPQLQANYSWSGDSLRIFIDQTQDPSLPVYRLPVIARVYPRGGGMVDFMIVDSLRAQAFVFPMASAPDSVVVDPEGWVLKQIIGNAAGGGRGGSFRLLQNYPNPFNGKTRIQYTVPVQSFVSLTVYDILGRKVATLVDQPQQAGEYAVPFEATGLASGVYFYLLRADLSGTDGRRTATGKMLLLR